MFEMGFVPLYLSHDDWALIWCAAIVASFVAGAGERPFRWVLRAEAPEDRWRKRPLRPVISILLVVFVVLFPCYRMPADLDFLTQRLSAASAWREFAIGWTLGSMKVLAAALVVVFVNRQTVRPRKSGMPEISGVVASTPTVLGPLGDVDRHAEFEVTGDDGASWIVESDVRRHWPSASLAYGYTVRRIAITQEEGSQFRGLKQGERVWILGGRPVPGAANRVVVAQPEGVLVRGGILAARTALLPLTLAMVYVILYVIPYTWKELEWLRNY